MPKRCKIPNCKFPVFAKGLCKAHQFHRYETKAAYIKLYKIRPFSVKRARINKYSYSPSAKAFLLSHPLCEIKSPECTILSECVNHKKGKASITMLLDVSFWQPACLKCNNYIERHHAWAVENGHKQSRFN